MLLQSDPVWQPFPLPHGPHAPPQSWSVSSPFFLPSAQVDVAASPLPPPAPPVVLPPLPPLPPVLEPPVPPSSVTVVDSELHEATKSQASAPRPKTSRFMA